VNKISASRLVVTRAAADTEKASTSVAKPFEVSSVCTLRGPPHRAAEHLSSTRREAGAGPLFFIFPSKKAEGAGNGHLTFLFAILLASKINVDAPPLS
jgi:hypothetical protein